MSRRKHRRSLPAAEDTDSRFDTVIHWLLVALLLFMPLAFGAVEAWSELVVSGLSAALALCLALKLLWRRDQGLVWTWAYVPIALFLLLVVLQLLPLPAAVMRRVSPHTATLKGELLGDLPNADEELASLTLSFYPRATRHALRLLVAGAIVFVVVANVYRQPRRIKRLLGAVAAIAGGVALLALAQDLFGNGRIYWAVPIPHARANSGPFVCHSHYGQFMNLSIGAALGLLLVRLHEAFRHGPVTVREVVDRLGSLELRVVWYLAGAIVLGVATVFVSLTRGGMVSLLIAGGFTTVMLASRRALAGRGWVMVALALGAFICVLYIGFDAVYGRLATLRDRQAYEGRTQILEDLTVAFRRFPLLGTGLGTHAVVYPMFDRSRSPTLASHAENDYAQTLEETGLVGLALVLGFLGIVWQRYAHSIRRLRMPVRSAAFGLGFGLLAVMVHSASDFGQHLPANFCLTALTCGLLVALARMGGLGRRRPAWWKRLGRAQAVRLAGFVGVGAVTAWAAIGAARAWRAESHWRQALALEEALREKDWHGTNAEYAGLITEAERAAAWEPDNILYRHWLNVYRWRSLSRVRDPETGRVVVTPRTRRFARRIVAELHAARALCPTYGPTYCVVGQLEAFVLHQPIGAEHIRKGCQLASCDPTTTRVAALLDLRQGRAEAALAKFRRCLALGGVSLSEVVDLYLHEAHRPDLALAIAEDNVGALFRIADRLRSSGNHERLAAQARARAVALLEARCERPDAPPGVLLTLGGLREQEGDYAAAVACYRRALARSYGQVRWRLTLARLLAKCGRVQEAIHEARVCLRLRPQMTRARKLIADLSVLSEARAEP